MGSQKTVAASSKEILCFNLLIRFLVGSHSKCSIIILYVYFIGCQVLFDEYWYGCGVNWGGKGTVRCMLEFSNNRFERRGEWKLPKGVTKGVGGDD